MTHVSADVTAGAHSVFEVLAPLQKPKRSVHPTQKVHFQFNQGPSTKHN